MPRDVPPLPDTCDVAIIGGGPSGLAAATRLKELGICSVHVLERESVAGGIPRHCGHPPFGMREFKRCLTGPAYAAALVTRARQAGVHIHTNATATCLHEGGRLTVSTDEGVGEVRPDQVIISTGVRETPRAARLISGQRPLGILTTGALQSMVYLKHNVPFKRPIIVGTELVSFSALLTCRHAGIKPVAMVEANEEVTARSFCRALPMLMGIPLLTGARLVEILGKDRVTGVRIADAAGDERMIDCDGVLFTGQFTPESALLRMSHLRVDPASGGPVVDQVGRCSDPAYIATGNLLHPVETAGWCWREGRRTGDFVAAKLAGQLPPGRRQVAVTLQTPIIKFIVPQVLSNPSPEGANRDLQLRFNSPTTGRLSLQHQGRVLWSQSISSRPERRVLIPLPSSIDLSCAEPLEVCFEEKDQR